MTSGILFFGAYLPMARLQRSVVAAANAWIAPGLKGLGKGERTMANWDEDPVTMATEAARDCLAGCEGENQVPEGIDSLYLASTTFPFIDRQNSAIVAEALNLPQGVHTMDIASSLRAGTSALLAGLKAAAHGETVLVIGAEKRRAKAATAAEMNYGDGASALLLGKGDAVAELVGSHSLSVDFVDHYRTAENGNFDYPWEERWVRDEGYMKIIPAAVKELLEKCNLQAADIQHFCCPVGTAKLGADLAKKLGIDPAVLRPNLGDVCGDTGAAHPLILLVHCLETAKPGDHILVFGFGQGCDALLFRATPHLAKMKGSLGVSGHLKRQRKESNYNKFLAFHNLINIDYGLRSEVDKQTGLSTHYRNKDLTEGLIGGVCSQCGTHQIPKSRICVNPNCNAVDTQSPQPFSNVPVSLMSYTADQLTYSLDPPAYYGMVEFQGGGRLMADFSDVDPARELKSGMPMRMMFRVKDYDLKRGFRRYFWKAVPEYAQPVSDKEEK
jgi:hydroxymethylglutaryl-CoA synthase